MSEAQDSRRLSSSIWAVLAGFLVGAILSLGTDQIFHVLKVYPPLGERMSDGLFWVATAVSHSLHRLRWIRRGAARPGSSDEARDDTWGYRPCLEHCWGYSHVEP